MGALKTNAMVLFIHTFNDHINKHVRDNYLNPHEQWTLIGRAAGMPGTVGSTNGLERRNGIWKQNTHGLIGDKKTTIKTILSMSWSVSCTVCLGSTNNLIV